MPAPVSRMVQAVVCHSLWLALTSVVAIRNVDTLGPITVTFAAGSLVSEVAWLSVEHC